MGLQQPQSITVRTAEAADVPGIVACSAALFAEDAGRRDPAIDTSWPHAHGPDRFTAGLSDPDRLLLAAAEDGNIAGCLSGTLNRPSSMTTMTTAVLTAMWVHPEHRGSGVGAQLVQQFINWAKGQGAERAEVTAYAGNDGARRLYARQGFAAHSVTSTRTL